MRNVFMKVMIMTATLSRASSASMCDADALLFAPLPDTSSVARLTTAVRLSSALFVVYAVNSMVSLLVPTLLRDPPGYAGNALGTFVVALFVALPTMGAAMRFACHGSLRARFVWLGCAAYLFYNAVIVSFTLKFNELFLAYTAALSLATWSLVAVVRCIDVSALPWRFSARLPVRSIGAYLMLTAVAFGGLWLKDVLPAILAGTAPLSIRGTPLLTNAVEILDLAFTLPLCVAGAIWLWRRRAIGFLVTGGLLVMLTIESISVATDQYFGHRLDPAQPLTAVPLFVVLAVIGAVPLILFLRSIDDRAHR
jgi:hypothetical protein